MQFSGYSGYFGGNLRHASKGRGVTRNTFLAYKQQGFESPFFDALELLEPAEQERIYDLARQLTNKIPKLGAMQALELLCKMGAYMVKSEKFRDGRK